VRRTFGARRFLGCHRHHPLLPPGPRHHLPDPHHRRYSLAVTTLDTKIHSTHRWPCFLPDGQHFLYLASNHSAAQSEQNGVFVASLDGKLNRFLISSLSGAIFAQNHFLFVRDAALYVQPFDLNKIALTGSPSPITDGVVVDLGVWHATFTASETNELIYQTGSSMAHSRMEWVDLQGKHLSFVGEKGVYQSIEFDVTSDGKRFLLNAADDENVRPLTLLQNWTNLLPARP
jgi:eukaryotic-like serine/threonine-protein kinase